MLQTLLARLEKVKKSGNEYIALCPGHQDKHQSLSLTEKNGKILMKCFAGCSVDQICEGIGIEPKDLFGEINAKKGVTINELAQAKGFSVDFLESLGVVQHGENVRITYWLEDGKPAARQRIRTALRAKDGSIWEKGDGKPVCYGLWRLEEARNLGYIIIVEGESDCWTLWFHNYPALGIPGADMTGKLEAENLLNIPQIFIVQEPDNGGNVFINGMQKRLQEIGYSGKALVIKMPQRIKDPNDLHLKSKNFKKDVDFCLSNGIDIHEALKNLKEETESKVEILEAPEKKPDVEFPFETVHPIFSHYVSQIVGKTEAPPEYIVAALLTGISGAIGNRVN